QDAAIQADGEIVMAGFTGNGSGSIHNALALRLNSDGSLDTTYGTSGVTQFSANGYGDLQHVALQGDGKLIVVGDGKLPSGAKDMMTARLNTDGTLDTSF